MTGSKGKRILVVEDDQFIRDLYVELLRDEGYKLDVAVNGEEGYKFLHKGGYDLVLLDIIMPKMDATQVLEKLKKNPPKKKNKHIIFMTNLAQDNTVNHGKDFGVEGYLIKSDLTPDQFLKKIRELLK
jgi:two-component system sensor histidine kinase and response regulator WspE